MNKRIKMAMAAAMALAAVISFSGCETTGDHDHSSHKHTSAGVKPYPLKTCIVMDEKLDKDAIAFVHNGQQIKICCDGCKEDFDKDPDKYLKKLAGK